MDKFLCFHTVPGGSMTEEQVCQLAEAAQHDEHIRGYRSFVNLTEGKACCILEGESRDALARWFDKMQLPYDDILPLELEGERGTIHNLKEERAHAGAR